MKLCVTGGAATKLALPACVAVIEQEPGATSVTVLPETVQTPAVVEAKLTGSPELAVATRMNGAAPMATLPGARKVIVWVAAVAIVKVWITGVAAAKLALPACVAVIEQEPGATSVTVLPETVQTPTVVEAKSTGSPELAVAARANGAAPMATLPGATKLIVCV